MILGPYVEANPIRANPAARAEDWQWSCLRHRTKRLKALPLTDWPVDRPASWIDTVNDQISDEHMNAIRESIERGRPLGSVDWKFGIAKRLGLTQTLVRRGRPSKTAIELGPRERLRRRPNSRKGV